MAQQVDAMDGESKIGSFKTLAYPSFAFLSLLLFYPLLVLAYKGWALSGSEWLLEDPYFRHVIYFTYLQAALSAVLSGCLGTLGALVLVESKPRGALVVSRLSLIAFSLPPILGVLAFIDFWGKNGWVNEGLGFFSFPQLPAFRGWPAIVAAHVFFNFPIFLKTVSAALLEQDRSTEVAAISLGAGRWTCFREVTLRKLYPTLRNSFLITFLYSAASFVIVLMLGGGPRYSTIEVSLYQAIKIDFSPELAVRLAGIQLLISAVLYALLFHRKTAAEVVASRIWVPLYFPRRPWLKSFQWFGYAVLLFFLLAGPLLALISNAVRSAFLVRDWKWVWAPLYNSLVIGFLCAVFSLVLAFPLAYAMRHGSPWARRVISVVVNLPLSLSALLLTLAWLMAYPGLTMNFRGSGVAVAMIQSVIALPLVFRPLEEGFLRISPLWYQTAASLGSSPREILCLLELPLLRNALALGFLFGFAVSIGEVGAVLMFLSEATETLPYWVYHWMGQYRFEEAGASGGILLIVMAIMFWLGGKLQHDPKN